MKPYAILLSSLVAIVAVALATLQATGNLRPLAAGRVVPKKPSHCREDLPGCVPKEIKYIFMLHIPKVGLHRQP